MPMLPMQAPCVPPSEEPSIWIVAHEILVTVGTVQIKDMFLGDRYDPCLRRRVRDVGRDFFQFAVEIIWI